MRFDYEWKIMCVMNRRAAPSLPLAMGLWLLCLFMAPMVQAIDANRPNFVIIFTDDLGYGDLGSFGSESIKTPNIDRMATEGRRFTNFMVASPLCTPSRAALLTGSYPKRVDMPRVLFPYSQKGLNPDEFTIADLLKSEGYATACIGKWHLGHHPETLPMELGFDRYYGIPYSNDMNHPDNKNKPKGGPDGMDALWKNPGSTLTEWNTPLMENDVIIEVPVDQRTITRRYTDQAIEFITENKDTPFFLYLPHSMPHIPLYVPDDYYDPDPKNAYIRVIEHIDAEVGRLIEAIESLGLDDNTVVIFTSDNGPWLRFEHHAGSAGPLRAGKGTTFEGGQRVPCVAWGPGHIPAGTESDELFTTLDLLPTIAAMTNSELPANRIIDGLNASALLLGDAAPSPRHEFLYYNGRTHLEGIRVGNWKLLVKPKEPKIQLFNLNESIGETTNLAEAHPHIVDQLRRRMEQLDREIGKNKRTAWYAEGAP